MVDCAASGGKDSVERGLDHKDVDRGKVWGGRGKPTPSGSRAKCGTLALEARVAWVKISLETVLS